MYVYWFISGYVRAWTLPVGRYNPVIRCITLRDWPSYMLPPPSLVYQIIHKQILIGSPPWTICDEHTGLLHWVTRLYVTNILIDVFRVRRLGGRNWHILLHYFNRAICHYPKRSYLHFGYFFSCDGYDKAMYQYFIAGGNGSYTILMYLGVFCCVLGRTLQ